MRGVDSSTVAVFLFSVTVMGLLNTGCFVLTSERRNRPVAPHDAIQVNPKSEELKYSRVFHRPDFDLNVGVENGPNRWEAVFLFYVLPLPQRFDYLSRAPVKVEIHLRPKCSGIAFDPWRVFFLGSGTNQVRVVPSNVWQEQRWLGTNAASAVAITNDSRFSLEFSDWSRMYPDRASSLMEALPDRDLPFRVSVEGILDSGLPVVLPSITFRPTAHLAPGFRLPY